MHSILFVCLGNICRSPAAEGILKNIVANVDDWHIESCGLEPWHIGCLPDSRMRLAASKHNIELNNKAQAFDRSFFKRFDYILAADTSVFYSLMNMAKTDEDKGKIKLMNEFSDKFYGQDVPDPYDCPQEDYEYVLDMLKDACMGLWNHINGKSGNEK